MLLRALAAVGIFGEAKMQQLSLITEIAKLSSQVIGLFGSEKRLSSRPPISSEPQRRPYD
jgi:hypothetical protein